MRTFLCSHGDLLDYCGTIITRIKSSAEALSLVIAIPLAPLSHFHVGVKSVPHWLQLNGTG